MIKLNYIFLLFIVIGKVFCNSTYINLKFDYFYEVKIFNETNGIKDIKDINNNLIATVKKSTYYELLYTGCGFIENKNGSDTIISLYNKDKFEYVNSKNKFALGKNNKELIPFRSVSTNRFKLGTYIKVENFNSTIPKINEDGCFRVDDNNSENNKITIFTGKNNTLNTKPDTRLKVSVTKNNDKCF